MADIVATGLSRSYGAVAALQGVDVHVEGRQIVGLLGKNGAGKTTAIRILTAQLAPTGGSARVRGHDVVLEPLEVRRVVGYLPESAPLYDELTVAGHLSFVGRARGMASAELARATERVVTATGLGARLGQAAGTLSKGYRQRVGLALAMLHDPAVLILDEPTSGLDPEQVVEIRSLVRELGRTRTVLLSTHVLTEVEATCDRVLLLHEGRLVADERTDTLVASATGASVVVGLGAGKVKVAPEALAAELAALDGVRDVRPLAGDLPRFALLTTRDVRADVFAWAVARGHVLVELAPDRRPLEQVFLALTGAAAP